MRVALYYPWLYLKSGVERTILETLKRSRHRFTIFTNHYDPDGTYPEFKNVNIIELKKISVKRDFFSVLLSAIIICFQKINLRDYNLLLVQSEGLGDLILFRNNVIPAVCFCHTPLRPVFDDEYRKHALNGRSLPERGIYSIFAFLFKTFDRYLWSKYVNVSFNSQTSLERAGLGGLLTRKQKNPIIAPGCDWETVKPSGNFHNYFLVPGRIMWTKNIELAIESFKIFYKCLKPKNNFQLIIAGQVDKKSEPYYVKLKTMSTSYRNIRFIRNPSDNKMKELFRNAYTILATSFNEDWGLVPLEANSYGKPVLCVNNGGFKESQIKGITGFLLPPFPEEFAKKMLYLTKNKKILFKIGKSARQNSKKYSWVNFIKKFDNFIESSL